MKKAAFEKLIKSMDEAREIHSGKRLPSRVLRKDAQKTIRLTKEEKAIEAKIEHYVSVEEKEFKEIVKAITRIIQRSRLNNNDVKKHAVLIKKAVLKKYKSALS